MAKRFSPPQPWATYIQQVLADYGGIIPAEWTIDTFITKVSALAGHPSPHSAIPGAKKALKELLQSGKVRRADGAPRLLRKQRPVPHRKSLVPVPPKHLRQVQKRERVGVNGDGFFSALVALTMETAESSQAMASQLTALQREMRSLADKQGAIEERRRDLREAMEGLLREE